MADNTLNHRYETYMALESAKHIGVLLSWIERARELADTFDHLIRCDEKFKNRCKENSWFPIPWEEPESQALVDLVGIQEGCIRKVIACNETQSSSARAQSTAA